MSTPTPAKKFWKSVRINEGEPDLSDDSPESWLRYKLWGMQIKATGTRVAALMLLSEKRTALTAEAIARRLGHTHSTATIYRSIAFLTEAELIVRIERVDQKPLYKIASKKP